MMSSMKESLIVQYLDNKSSKKVSPSIDSMMADFYDSKDVTSLWFFFIHDISYDNIAFLLENNNLYGLRYASWVRMIDSSSSTSRISYNIEGYLEFDKEVTQYYARQSFGYYYGIIIDIVKNLESIIDSVAYLSLPCNDVKWEGPFKYIPERVDE